MISATVRDIAIIVIAVETIIINLLLGILIWQIWRLVRMVQRDVKPIIQDTQDTVGTVRGTADFVSHNMVRPVIKVAGTVAGWRRTWQVLAADLRGWRTIRPSRSASSIGPSDPPAPETFSKETPAGRV